MGSESQPIQLIWGCQASRQFEQHWLLELLHPLQVRQLEQLEGELVESLQLDQPRVLVESGLLLLERQPAPERISQLQHSRHQRIEQLAALGPFAVIHLSDEEGLDGDQLYPLLPADTPIWRNFPYPRFEADRRIQTFPIGPRREFFGFVAHRLASGRSYPWAFMGTLWASGSRTEAVSVFLQALPEGMFFGGKHFGLGLPLPAYRGHLLNSVFALCPEGDRHLDTFRLYESLQLGCIPLLVDRQGMAAPLLGPNHPLPLFSHWRQALAFAQQQLPRPEQLDRLQRQIQHWWANRKAELSSAMRGSLIRENPPNGQLD